MAFNSMSYGLFLIPVFFGYWLLVRRRGARLLLLLAASYFFYSLSDPRHLTLLAAITVLNYGAGLVLVRLGPEGRGRAGVMAGAAIGSLGLLAAFKYYNFFAANADAALQAMGLGFAAPAATLALPIGISFYTFQALGYTVDVYRGRTAPVRSLRDFALFVSYFPHLVAGPILRAGTLLPQLEAEPQYHHERAMSGLFLILSGLFKKMVLADLLATALVEGPFAHPDHATLPLSWLAMYGFALQIYCDFSGYTDIAIGSSRLLGIEIPINFDRPYLATDPRDFWRRWHISLSTWLRDYLYISLGGNRKGRGRMYAAIFITMLLGGLWHGAAWTFVAWGAYHGVLLMVSRWRDERRSKSLGARVPSPAQPFAHLWLHRLITFHLVCLGWVLFRSASLHDAGTMLANLVAAPLVFSGVPVKGLALLILAMLLHVSPAGWKDRLQGAFAGLPIPVQGAALAAALALFSLVQSVRAPFIYFQF
jgi:alginate O-acetyltransferase complex protein AlgI